MVIVILLFTYRSPILWLLPVVSAGAALLVAQAVIYFLAKNFDLTVNGQSQGILTVLVFGAGTDYALLLVARYREELRRHEDRHEAMAFALHRAAPAIIASASTVILGMLCLLLAEMNSTAGLGPVSAIGIAVGPAGDDHPAAGAARDHRAVDLLAAAPEVRFSRADQHRLVGQGRRSGSRRDPASVWVVTPCCWRSPASASSSWSDRPDDRGVTTPRSSTR